MYVFVGRKRRKTNMTDERSCCGDIKEAERRFGSTNRRICWLESMLCFLVLLIWRRHPKSWPSCSVNPSFRSHMLSDKQPLEETVQLDRFYWSLSTVIPAGIWNLGCKRSVKQGMGGNPHRLKKLTYGSGETWRKKERKLVSVLITWLSSHNCRPVVVFVVCIHTVAFVGGYDPLVLGNF